MQSDNQQPESVSEKEQHDTVAASAAERAITDKTSPAETSDLVHLAAAVEKASLDPPKTSDSTALSATEQPKSESPDIDPTLTKEELVEEALNCPCISSMRDGPCGDPFISAYKCFLESETEPKGMDCMDQFKTMQSCIGDHPDEYNLDDEDDADPFAPQKSSSASPAASPAASQSENTTTPPSAEPTSEPTSMPDPAPVPEVQAS